MSTKTRYNTLQNKWSSKNLPYLLVFPVVLYILCVMVFPFLWAVYVSFTDKVIGVKGNFVGLKNYIDLLTDKIFLKSIINTFIFTCGSVFLKVVFGIAMVLALNERIKGRNAFRAIFLLPWTIPTVVVVLIWQWMFSDVGGVLNAILQGIGFQNPVLWLSEPKTSMFSVILVNTWKGTPFIAISVLSGLQGISPIYYEAAKVDGTNAIQRFIHITIPQLKDVISLATLMTTIWTMNNFEVIWLLTRGGPSNATNVVAIYSFITAFKSSFLSKGIASSVLSLPLMIVLINKITRKLLEE
jgi:multiple sugar transport system permease protein